MRAFVQVGRLELPHIAALDPKSNVFLGFFHLKNFDFNKIKRINSNLKKCNKILRCISNDIKLYQILFKGIKTVLFCTYSVPIEIKKPFNFLKGLILLVAGTGLEPVTFGL